MSDVPEILKLKQLSSELPESLGWQELWDFRTKVGDLMVGATVPETHSILKTVYNDLTEKLKARAEELGKGKEFAEADKLARLTLESHDVFEKIQGANSGLELHDILNDPEKQNELAALQSVIEAGGMPNGFINQSRDLHKSAYRIAKSARAGERLRFKDILGFAMEWVRDKIK